MPKNLFPLDNSKKFTDQQHVGHNRWHPDIPPQVSVKPGDVFRADCREWFDGAIKNDDSADDVRNAPLPGVHVLSGPFRVEGAQPGDLLVVDILEIDACDQEDEGPLSGMGWGYTGVFAKTNGGGFLTDRFPDAYKVIWDFTGDVATSRHIPECSYVGIHHPGLMGTAPSAELLAKWTKRETDLIATDPDRVRRWPCRRCPTAPSSATSPGPSSTAWHPRPRAPHRHAILMFDVARPKLSASVSAAPSQCSSEPVTRCSRPSALAMWTVCRSRQSTHWVTASTVLVTASGSCRRSIDQ